MRTVTDTIRSHLATQTTLDVGDSQAPTDSTRPYLVLYNTGPAAIDGDLSNPNSEQNVEYQITSVGDTREQAEWAQDKARAAMAVALTPPSGYSFGAPMLQPVAAGTSRDDAFQPPLFYAVDVYRLLTTPS